MNDVKNKRFNKNNIYKQYCLLKKCNVYKYTRMWFNMCVDIITRNFFYTYGLNMFY